MRALSAEHDRVYASGSYADHLRVSIRDADGTWRDLSSYGGVNWIDSVEINGSVDDPHATANIGLRREVEGLSLATLMEASPLNLGLEYPGTYAPLVDAAREVKVEAGLGCEGEGAPVEWLEVFRGYVDVPDWGAAERVTLECRDQGAQLAKAFIERERAYGFSSTAAGGLLVWKAEESFAVGDLMTPPTPNGFYYRCTAAGVSGPGEPSWPVIVGDPVTDGAVTWTCEAATSSALVAIERVLQQLINDNVPGGPTLYTPTSPGWALTPYMQDRTSTLDALHALVDQIGWDLRFAWRASSGAFELTLSEPDRAKTTPDRVFGPDDYSEVTRCAVDVAGVRNVIRVIYRDTADLWPDGTPKRKVVEVSDAASIARFGRLFGEVAEEATPQLNTAAEATALASAILSDLALPGAELIVTAPFAPFVQLGDLYEFAPNGRHFSSAQRLAVVAYSHSLSSGDDGTTTYTLRGQPSGGYRKWIQRLAHPGVAPAQMKSLFPERAQGFAIGATPGGARVTCWSGTSSGNPASVWDGAEYHLSPTSGFVPSPATLIAVGQQASVEIHTLRPGTTYYARAVPRRRSHGRVIRGSPTPQIAVEAGRLSLLHFNPELGGMMQLPPNGDFESYFDGPGEPPDFWTADAGEWGTDLYASEEDSHSGALAIAVADSPVAVQMRCAYFPVSGGVTYALRAWARNLSASGEEDCEVLVEWYDRAKEAVSTSVLPANLPALGAGWAEISGSYAAPPGAAFARVAVVKTIDSPYGFLVDAITLTR